MTTMRRLSVTGMSCAGCVSSVEDALNGVQGVVIANVNFAEHTATVEGDAASMLLIGAVRTAGYDAAELINNDDEAGKEAAEEAHYRTLMKKAAFAAAIGLPLFVFGMSGLLPTFEAPAGRLFWLGVGALTAMMLNYSGGHFFSGAWKSARNHNANMDTLIALGTGTAWFYSMVIVIFPEQVPLMAQHAYFEAAAIIIALINFGSALEAKARGKTSEAIRRLIGLKPKTARVVRDGVDQDIPIEDVRTGDTLRVRPGDRIAVDGEIIDGQSSIDESMLTGEPIPVQKQAGDEIVAGSINKLGSFLFTATRVGSDTALSRIIESVRRAQASKPAIGRMADKIAAVFVPSVLIVSTLTFLAWVNFGGSDQVLSFAIVTAMTVLIIACPCALGLATPISIMAGVGKAAEFGVLIRNGDALQQAGKLDTIVLDKTGTVTEGRPSLSSVLALGGWTEEKILQFSASVEKGSEHSLAEAFINAAIEKKISLIPVQDFAAIAGQGVGALAEGHTVLLGNQKLMIDRGIDLSAFDEVAAELTRKAHTPVFLAVDEMPAGVIGVADAIKPDSEATVRRMKESGLTVVLLTGDNRATGDAVAQQVGIDTVLAEVLPHEKANKIAELQAQGAIVGMVGDGINDAPALALADVGFAIGTGTDIAIESADITLMRGSLLGVVDAIAISNVTVRNIKQNLFGAFIYNSLGIPIAAGVLYPLIDVLLNPMIAGGAMAMSSLSVVLNANRLRFFKPRNWGQ